MAQTNPCVTQPGPDHAYVAGSNNPMSFGSRKRTIPPVKKSIVSLLCILKPASVDPESLFSFGGIAKTFKRRITPSNHNRNVFLNKNKFFLNDKVLVKDFDICAIHSHSNCFSTQTQKNIFVCQFTLCFQIHSS